LEEDRLVIRLNKTQRRIAIGTAAVILLIQSIGILENGLEENRNWVMTFLVAAVLLGAGFSKADTDAADPTHKPRATPTPPPAQPMASVDKDNAMALMRRAGEVVSESNRMGERWLSFVLENGLYHNDGALSFVLDPEIHSALAAHATIIIALTEATVEPDRLVWETYRTTLAHRLAEKRARDFIATADALGTDLKLGQNDIKPEFLTAVKGEMEIWESLTREAPHPGKEAERYGKFLHHVAATFGGRKEAADDEKFIPLFHSVLEDARQKVVPLLRK
jgi:hypothetical protein